MRKGGVKDFVSFVSDKKDVSIFAMAKDAGMGCNLYTSFKSEKGIKLSTLERLLKTVGESLVLCVGDEKFKLECK